MHERSRAGRHRVTLVVAAIACLSSSGIGAGGTRQQNDRLRVVALLDRYERGDHDGVVAELAAVSDIGAFARELQRRAEAWTTAAPVGPASVARRRLVVAVFTLEMASAHLETEWGTLRYTVEWACEWMRKGRPTSIERVWHLAVVALAGGARDEQLLAYFPPSSFPDPMLRNRFTSFVHADHAARRFPEEIRFRFAEAFASGLPGLAEPQRDAPLRLGREERETGATAIRSLKKFVINPVVGAEAHLRIGYIYYCLGDTGAATLHYQAALHATQDPFVAYLAHFMMGRLFEAQDRGPDAVTAYRQALAVLPRVQSGTMALAAKLFRDEKPGEAYELVNAAFAAQPRPPDPWRLYGYGDYRFWPDLIGRLRAEITR
jgi:tetratricopeptide (TPR) repeat protein